MSLQPPKFGEPADYPEIASLYAELGQLNPFQFNWTLTSALKELEQAKTLVIKDSGQIRSFLTYRDYDDRLEIMAIGASPRIQRQGEGRLLLKQLKSWADAAGKPIWLEVHENNLAAHALYQSEGFKLAGQRKSYYKDGARALVMMWTFLNNQS